MSLNENKPTYGAIEAPATTKDSRRNLVVPRTVNTGPVPLTVRGSRRTRAASRAEINSRCLHEH